MLNPPDQTAVSSKTSAIQFSGYYTSPGASLDLQAWNPTTHQWQSFGGATSSSGAPAFKLFGWDMWAWNAGSKVIPSSLWKPGSQGAMARVGTKTDVTGAYAVMPNVLSCYTAHRTDLSDFVSNCATPDNVARICTSNYVPYGRGRSDCTRSVDMTISDGRTKKIWLGDGTMPYIHVFEDLVEGPGISSVSIRGDRRLVVDLFNAPLYDQSDVRISLFDGIIWYTDPLFFNVIRMQYPYSRTDTRTYSKSVASAIADLGMTPGVQPDTWSPPNTFVFGWAHSARVYDLGECNYGVGWEDLALAVQAELEPLIEQGLAAQIPLIEWVNLEDFFIRPVLVRQGIDRIYAQASAKFKVDISCCNTAKLVVKVMLRPVTSSTLPFDVVVEDYSVTVYDVNGVILHIVDRWFLNLQQAMEDLVADNLPESLGQYVIDALASSTGIPAGILGTLRARRVVENGRGVDLVLAEDTTDSQYSQLNNFGLCSSTPAPALERHYWYQFPY
jgi:hypothetical protein